MDDVQCPTCLGLGYVDVVSPKNPQKNICTTCAGYGLLDWVSQISGKRTLNSKEEIAFIVEKFRLLAKEKGLIVIVANQKVF